MSRAALIAAEQIAQINAIGRVLHSKMIESLEMYPQSDGIALTIAGINDLLVDDNLTNRPELRRFGSVKPARTDQQLEARREPPMT